MSDFDRFETMSFDCYGTLIDWETGIANALRPWATRNALTLEEIERLGVGRDRLVHVAESLFHDHQPAAELGLPSVWIHRRHAKGGTGATATPADDVSPTWRFTSMAEFADAAVPA
jgi:FMN phosphatase YigB (HAD superfamily)